MFRPTCPGRKRGQRSRQTGTPAGCCDCNFFSALGLELIVGISVANRFAPAPPELLQGEDMASKQIRLTGATRRRPVAAGTLASMLAALLLATLTFAAPYLSAGKDKKDKKDKLAQSKTLKGLPITELSEDEAILHAFNRLAFGPRPASRYGSFAPPQKDQQQALAFTMAIDVMYETADLLYYSAFKESNARAE